MLQNWFLRSWLGDVSALHAKNYISGISYIPHSINVHGIYTYNYNEASLASPRDISTMSERDGSGGIAGGGGVIFTD